MSIQGHRAELELGTLTRIEVVTSASNIAVLIFRLRGLGWVFVSAIALISSAGSGDLVAVFIANVLNARALAVVEKGLVEDQIAW